MSRVTAQRRFRLVATALGVAVAVATWTLAAIYINAVRQAEFDAQANEVVNRLRLHLGRLEDTTEDLAAQISTAHHHLDRTLFAEMAQRPLSRELAIRAIGWNQVITAADVPAVTRAGRTDYPGFRIANPDPGQPLATDSNSRLVVVRYIIPLDGNTSALGLNTYGEPARQAAIDHALATGLTITSAPIRLVQEQSDQAGVLLFAPVFDRVGSGTLGFAVAVLRIGDLVISALNQSSQSPAGVRITDKTAGPGAELLFEQVLALPPPGSINPYQRELPFAGRTWVVSVQPGPRFTSFSLWPPLLALVSLLVFALVVAWIIARDKAQTRTQEARRLEGLGVLAGGIAHDFNNLMTTVLGRAELELTRNSDPATRTSLKHIAKAAEQAGDLTQQLLTYAGRTEGTLTSVDLTALLVARKPALQRLLQPGQELDLVHPGTPLLVRGNANLLGQMLDALVCNAAEASTQDHSRILVSLGQHNQINRGSLDLDRGLPAPALVAPTTQIEGTHAVIAVVDSGTGISPEVRDTLTDPFFSTKGIGRGMGLAAVLGIVERHRGGLWLTSAPGIGTAVQVTLPTAQAALPD